MNAKLTFGEDPDHAQESIFRLLENLIYDRTTLLELTEEDPLNIFVLTGPDGMAP